MRGLLVKDMRMMMGQKKFFGLVVFMTIILNFSSNTGFVVYYVTFVCSFFAMNSIGYDEADNGYPFLFSLPIDRSIYIREKYLFGIILSVISWLAGMCVCFIFEAVKHTLSSFTENIVVIAAILPIMLIFNAIVFPLLFKFGSEKGRIVMLCVFGMVFFMGYVLSKMMDPGNLFRIVSGCPTIVLGLSIVAVTLVVLAVSYTTSVVIMKKKEL